MSVIGFDEAIPFRMRSKEVRRMKAILRRKSVTYDSKSHFVRCAVIKLIKYEEDLLEDKRRGVRLGRKR